MSQLRELQKLLSKLESLVSQKEKLNRVVYAEFQDSEGHCALTIRGDQAQLYKALAIKLTDEQIANYIERISREYNVNIKV